MSLRDLADDHAQALAALDHQQAPVLRERHEEADARLLDGVSCGGDLAGLGQEVARLGSLGSYALGLRALDLVRGK